MKPLQLGEQFYRNVKQGVLQFVFLRPVISVLALILAGWNLYEEGDFSYKGGYLYCSLVSNVSVSISLYYLVLLYTVTKDSLDKSVFYKFICVKSLVFFSFWQSCAFALLIKTGIFGGENEAARNSIIYQNLLLCVELVVVAYYIWKSFSFKEFLQKEKREYSVIKSVGEVLNVKDILDDARDTFSGIDDELNYSGYTWED
jgi:hypothetical protein